MKPPSTTISNKDIGQPYRNSDITSHSLKSSFKSQTTQELESSLLNARYRKKLAVTNAQVLSNRISLLKKEEERARKKMFEAKERENKILKIREEQIRLAIERDLIMQKQSDDHKQQLLHQAQEEEVKRQKRILQGMLYVCISYF